MSERKRRARGEGGVSWDEKRQRWIAEKTVGYDGRGKKIVRKASGTSQSAALRELAKRVKAYRPRRSLGARPDQAGSRGLARARPG